MKESIKAIPAPNSTFPVIAHPIRKVVVAAITLQVSDLAKCLLFWMLLPFITSIYSYDKEPRRNSLQSSR
jgi:hypothetical protein